MKGVFLLLVPGQSFVDSLIHNFWGSLVIKLVLVMGFVLVAPIVVIYAELKIMAHMQHRLGPMYAGRFHGVGQPIADGIKLIQKEDVVPSAADSWIFTLAPAVVLVPYIALF
ncbi:MAG TPA: NADH-quinone oxidoreductase subunit H, partial [Actinomycetota bacterium]|nr:NADH-quinone oxidoreductase subunit H [Actinomycetota bacterium]